MVTSNSPLGNVVRTRPGPALASGVGVGEGEEVDSEDMLVGRGRDREELLGELSSSLS